MSVKIKIEEGVYSHFCYSAPNAMKYLLIELPHGSTKSKDFLYYQERLQGKYPENLIDFFHVNTDVGSPELAFALAEKLQREDEEYEVHVMQSHIPRTFIDCNRVVGEGISYQAGGVTPATPAYVQSEQDLQLLYQAYHRYQDYTKRLYAEICGAKRGLGLMLHTYAPRTVPIQAVDWDIVHQLHDFYDTDKIKDCALRPQIDVIHKTPAAEALAALEWHQKVAEELRNIGLEVANGDSYPLHPVTMAYHYAKQYPAQTLCMEIRRDLVVTSWDPFVEMEISQEKVEKLGACLARSLVL